MKWSKIKAIADENLGDDHWGDIVAVNRSDWDKIAAVVDTAIALEKLRGSAGGEAYWAARVAHKMALENLNK